MPVQYPSGIIAEVRAVRTGAGLFDVSHMGRVYISGPSATAFLDCVLTGSAETLEVGRARYCMICNSRGGVIDDTIFYRLAQHRYLLIPNAGNRHRVLDWFGQVIGQRFRQRREPRGAFRGQPGRPDSADLAAGLPRTSRTGVGHRTCGGRTVRPAPLRVDRSADVRRRCAGGPHRLHRGGRR